MDAMFTENNKMVDANRHALRGSVPQVMTIQEASTVSTLSQRTIRSLIASGELRVRRIGRRVVIGREDLAKLMGVQLN